MTESETDVGTSRVIRRGDTNAQAISASDSGAGVMSLRPASGIEGRVREARPPVLVGHRIPSRNPTVRRLVVGLFAECSWLTRPDVPASVRWAVLSEKFRRLAETLDKLPGPSGVVKVSGGDMEPRKALGELRALSGEITRLEAALGITAASRAALGVDVGRLRAFDAASQVQQLRAERGNDGG